MKNKKSILIATLCALFSVEGLVLFVNNSGNLLTSASIPYSCNLPNDYSELSVALAKCDTVTPNTYKLRGTVTRSSNGNTYIQRVNQTNQELDAIKLINSSTYTPGNVIDITGGTLKTVDNVPCLDATNATIVVAYGTNPTGYDPLIYNSVSSFTNHAFSADTYNYSHFVEIDNVVVAFASDTNNIVTLFDASNEGARMNAIANSTTIANKLDEYHYQDSVVNIKGILDHFQNEDILRVVSVDDISLASSSIRFAQDTTIFHAFNWSIASILNQLDTIKANGFKTIQLSPMQPQKDYYDGYTWEEHWWKLYQPLGLSIANLDNQSRIGKRSELIELTTRAKEKGIGIIADVVANHLAGGSYNSFNFNVRPFETDIFDQNLYHGINKRPSDSDYESIVKGSLSADYPDLQTENSVVQNRVLELLKDYIDCGVTGFRFDAAKHIETPSDTQYSSSFWSTVLNGATSYANSTKNLTPYYYGEVLSPGNNRSWGWYSSLMSVTDSYRGDLVRNAITSKNINTIDTGYISEVGNDKTVLWIESHDNYTSGATRSVSQSDIHKGYAIIASRSNASSLYLARPNDGYAMGSYSTAYNNPIVKASNIFHNELVGASEYVKKSNGCFINVRKGEERHGAVIVKVGNNSVSQIDLNVDSGFMISDGVYKELVSGNTVTVTNGIVNASFTNDVMVLLKDTKAKYGLMVGSTPIYASKVDEYDGYEQYKISSHKFKQGEQFSLYNFENKDGWVVDIDSYSFGANGNPAIVNQYLTKGASTYTVNKDFTADVYMKMKYNADQIYFGLTEMTLSKDNLSLTVGDSNEVIINQPSGNITITNSDNSVVNIVKEGTTLNITALKAGSAVISVNDTDVTKYINVTVNDVVNEVTLYFSNNMNWSSLYCYTFGDNGSNANWPGETMTFVKYNEYSQGIYKYTIDLDSFHTVIFTNGNGEQTVDISIDDVKELKGIYLTNKNSQGKYNIGTYQYNE